MTAARPLLVFSRPSDSVPIWINPVPDTPRPRLKVSREGIVLIKSFEGFRPRAVRDENGRWTIGYGHTASAREGLTVGEQDAELLLQYDLLPVVKALNEQVAIPLNQHQFDALASFAVSVGVERFLASDVLRRLNAGHAGEAADALIGWPEPPAPDTALRRRAAERALFVADPEAPIHLADLLAAPLPPPAARPEASSPADARAAAVAALLGEGAEDEAPDAEEAAAPVSEAGAAAAPAFGAWAPREPAFLPPAQASVHHRFSPYPVAVSGPLPGVAELDAGEIAESLRPLQASLRREPPPAAPGDAGPTETAEEAAEEPASPEISDAPEQPLVLTPPMESDFGAMERPAWEPDQTPDPGVSEGELFDRDEPPVPVLRHENDAPRAKRLDWSDTGAFFIMGLVGLAACAASAASFRKAITDDAFIGDFTIIGWVLALIGAICVGVSSWNLYVRWGRRD